MLRQQRPEYYGIRGPMARMGGGEGMNTEF